MDNTNRPQPVRLAELLGALSLAVDLGFDQPMEHVLRQCWIALRLADCLEQSEEERAVTYYTALLTNVGCHTDAHEQAKWFGDDIALRSGKYVHGIHGIRPALAGLQRIGSGRPPLHRFRVGLDFFLSGRLEVDGMIARHAAMAKLLAKEVNLPPDVQKSVAAAYEQWDGNGWPGELRKEEIPASARVSQIAEFIEVAHRTGGIPAARSLAEQLAGKQFDPGMAAVFSANADRVLSGLEDASAWNRVVAGEPGLRVPLTDQELDQKLVAIADFIDLKTPHMLGHARGVDALITSAGQRLNVSDRMLAMTRRAGLVFGWGRLGISNSIWDKPTTLGAAEKERVRLQPYFTERILAQSPGLADIGEIAGRARERLDGSGYPRGLSGGQIGMPSRLLGAVDAYQSMLEPRPYRAARTRDEAAAMLRDEARAGRLDETIVDAVLASSRPRVRPNRPSGLTPREVEILRLVAWGMSSKQIAQQLSISPKTVRNHIEHVYAKTGVTNRVAASHYAIKLGLFNETSM